MNREGGMVEARLTQSGLAQLREEWLRLEQEATGLELEFAKNADAYGLGSPGDPTVGPRAAVSAARATARAAWLEYQDALARYQQQAADEQAAAADSLAKTNTKLAHVQAWLAAAITLATIVQTILAIVKD